MYTHTYRGHRSVQTLILSAPVTKRVQDTMHARGKHPTGTAKTEHACYTYARACNNWCIMPTRARPVRSISEISSCFLGRDPGTLKSDIVSKKHPQLICSDLRLSN